MINADVLSKAVLNFGPFSHKKLQKICYYVYSWYITVYKRDLFSCHFEAWRHGPVCPNIYDMYKYYGADNIEKYNTYLNVDNDFMVFVSVIAKCYSDYSANELELLTHTEEPWVKARIGFKPYESCNNIIQVNDIVNYYSKHPMYSYFINAL